MDLYNNYLYDYIYISMVLYDDLVSLLHIRSINVYVV